MIVALIANIVGTLLPDIDQASNRLWDLLPGGDFLGEILKDLFLAHRTLSHSILGLTLVYFGGWWIIPKIFNANFVNTGIVFDALLIGYISHLLLDGLTEEGLPLLFPIKWKIGFPPIKKLRVNTGKFTEKWIVFPLILIFTVWITVSNWKMLWGYIK